MKRLIIILILFSSLCYGEIKNNKYDLRKVKWGMSKKEVKENERKYYHAFLFDEKK